MTRLLAAIAILFLIGASDAAEPCPGDAGDAQITGEVRRGTVFEAAVGGGLAFRLVPTVHGWTIWIGDPATPDDNYAAVATPPFRGINPLFVEGWHFRDSDNSGPNRAGPKNINAPQEVRAFRFVGDRDSFLGARAALGVTLWPGASKPEAVAAAARKWREMVKHCGRLTVTALTLGNLHVGEKAWIDRLAFTVAFGD
jgi:hypothetical protein